ncbi:MAG TPA: carbohydrate porin [Chthoniobacterales bacterium]
MSLIRKQPFSLQKTIAALLLTFPFVENASAQSSWWNGKTATGNWGGVRDTWASHGVAVTGYWEGNYYGVASGGLHNMGAFDEEFGIKLVLDFAKLTGNSLLDGLTFESKGRYKNGTNVNNYVGASSAFNPSNIQGGQYWRFRDAFFSYTTPELFGVKKLLTISGGWQDPYHYFAQQPDSKLFENNSINTSKGLSMSDITWSGTYAAWGGYIKVQPTDWFYAQFGMYETLIGATATNNNGLNFTRKSSGPEFIGETGFTPKLGADRLAGKYAFGSIYWNADNTSFGSEEHHDGRYNIYFQADQHLYREPSPEAPAPVSDGKTSKEPVAPAAPPKLTDQGLYLFSFFVFADEENNRTPFYFHAGFTYKGLIPQRDDDRLGVGFAYASYSDDKADAEKAAGKTIHQEHEALLEADYRCQINKWLYLQPFVQYIIRPGGTGEINDALVLGVKSMITF